MINIHESWNSLRDCRSQEGEKGVLDNQTDGKWCNAAIEYVT